MSLSATKLAAIISFLSFDLATGPRMETIYMVPTANEILFYTTEQSIQNLKCRSYLFNVWSTIDIFMVQPPTKPF